jgi:hypothetical protein
MADEAQSPAPEPKPVTGCEYVVVDFLRLRIAAKAGEIYLVLDFEDALTVYDALGSALKQAASFREKTEGAGEFALARRPAPEEKAVDQPSSVDGGEARSSDTASSPKAHPAPIYTSEGFDAWRPGMHE